MTKFPSCLVKSVTAPSDSLVLATSSDVCKRPEASHYSVSWLITFDALSRSQYSAKHFAGGKRSLVGKLEGNIPLG
jgi:hypothetical protein